MLSFSRQSFVGLLFFSVLLHGMLFCAESDTSAIPTADTSSAAVQRAYEHMKANKTEEAQKELEKAPLGARKSVSTSS